MSLALQRSHWPRYVGAAVALPPRSVAQTGRQCHCRPNTPCHCRPNTRRVLAWIATAIAAAVCAGGCVQRRMMIRSNPPGAQVYVDDYSIGTTPVSTSFTYYGKRKIRLVKDGYETLTVLQDIPPPWYEIFPIDFVAENVVPGDIRDHRTLDYTLVPQLVVPPEELMGRAENLRRGVHTATGTAPSAPATRINPPPAGGYPSTGLPGVAPPAPDIGGQPLYPLPR